MIEQDVGHAEFGDHPLDCRGAIRRRGHIADHRQETALLHRGGIALREALESFGIPVESRHRGAGIEQMLHDHGTHAERQVRDAARAGDDGDGAGKIVGSHREAFEG